MTDFRTLPAVRFQDVQALSGRLFKNRFIGGIVDDPEGTSGDEVAKTDDHAQKISNVLHEYGTRVGTLKTAM